MDLKQLLWDLKYRREELDRQIQAIEIALERLEAGNQYEAMLKASLEHQLTLEQQPAKPASPVSLPEYRPRGSWTYGEGGFR